MDFVTVNLGRVRALLNGRTVTNISASSPLVLTQVGTNLELSAPTVAAHLAASNPHGITTSSIGAATSSDLTSHTGNVNNPHGVTKAQVGLENVENKTSAQILAGLTNANIMSALDTSIRLWTESGPLNPLPLTRCRVNSYLNTLVVDIDPSQFITGTGTPAMAGESYENIHTMSPISKIVLQKLPDLGSAPTESQSIVLDKDEKFAGGIVDIIRGTLYVKYRVQEITSDIQFAFVGTIGNYSVFSYTPSSDTDPFGDMMYLSQDVYTAGTTTASEIGLASTHFPCSSVCSTYSASPGKMDVVAVPGGNNRNTIYIGVPSTVTTKSQLDTWLGGLSSPMKVRYPVMDWKIIPGRLIKCDTSGQCLKCTQPQSTLYAQYMIANE